MPSAAAADGISIAEAIRQAVAERIEARRRDPAFQARIPAGPGDDEAITALAE